MKSLAAYIMRGRMQAVIGIAGLGILSLLDPMFRMISLLSTASLALVALRLGVRESLWVVSTCVLVLCLSGMAMSGNISGSLVYGLLLWGPILPVALLLRTLGKLALSLEIALGLGVLAVAAIYLMVPDPSEMWLENLSRLLEAMRDRESAGPETEAVKQGLEYYSRFMSGIVVAGSLMSVILALLLGRWWQATLFNPGGFRTEFQALRLDPPAAYLGLGSIVVGFVATGLDNSGMAEAAWNISIIFLVLFALCGIAILHVVLNRKAFWLAGIYIAIMVIPLALLPVALLGLSDTWFNWRRLLR